MCALINLEVTEKRLLLCYVTDRRSVAPGEGSSVDPLLKKMDALIAAGVDWVQIREKDLLGKELAHVTQQALRSAAQSSINGHTRILVNDRLDVALAEGAGGVHLSGNGVRVSDAKRLVERIPAGVGRRDFLIGVSCHSPADAVAAAESGADYLFFGPVFATPSKLAFGAPQGVERLAEVCGKVSVPVIAIGGISLENAGLCIAAGAAGVAAIRLFQDAADPRKQASALRDILSRNSSQAGTNC